MRGRNPAVFGLAVMASVIAAAPGFDPVVVGKLADARLFQRGGPGYGQAVTAAELKQKLALDLTSALARNLFA